MAKSLQAQLCHPHITSPSLNKMPFIGDGCIGCREDIFETVSQLNKVVEVQRAANVKQKLVRFDLRKGHKQIISEVVGLGPYLPYLKRLWHTPNNTMLLRFSMDEKKP